MPTNLYIPEKSPLPNPIEARIDCSPRKDTKYTGSISHRFLASHLLPEDDTRLTTPVTRAEVADEFDISKGTASKRLEALTSWNITDRSEKTVNVGNYEETTYTYEISGFLITNSQSSSSPQPTKHPPVQSRSTTENETTSTPPEIETDDTEADAPQPQGRLADTHLGTTLAALRSPLSELRSQATVSFADTDWYPSALLITGMLLLRLTTSHTTTDGYAQLLALLLATLMYAFAKIPNTHPKREIMPSGDLLR